MYMFGINRTARETKTVEWLGRPGGTWKSGWYEDPSGMRWYSDMKSTRVVPNDWNWITAQYLEMTAGREFICQTGTLCVPLSINSSWGSTLKSTFTWQGHESIAVFNGSRFGLFCVVYDGNTIVTCVYDVATLISDVTRGAFAGPLNGDHDCASSRLLQGRSELVQCRYRVSVRVPQFQPAADHLAASALGHSTAFFTVGCAFEGDQSTLANSWFVIYPAIVEIVLIVTSLIDILARAYHRRINSTVVSVVSMTIMLLSLLHAMRLVMIRQRWYGLDGRVSSVVSSSEFASLTLWDYFTSDIALRLNGSVDLLLALKLALLFSNAIPLLFSTNVLPNHKRLRGRRSCTIERALAIRACSVGGMGSSDMYEYCSERAKSTPSSPLKVLNPYELVRLGVVGDRYLMSWEDWFLLLLIAPFRRAISWRNRRIMVLELRTTGADHYGCHNVQSSMSPKIVSIADFSSLCENWWDIDTRPIQ